MIYFLFTIAIVLTVFLVGVIFYYQNKEKILLRKLNRMIDAAINGDFKESVFDESMMSALEAKFSQYLSSQAASSKNLSFEKEKIKELLSDISHQTKTPIANIMLYSQLLSEQNIGKESRTFAHSLSVQAEKLNFLIGSLIKISRLEAGIVKLAPKRNNISKMLIQVKEQISLKAQAKKISISIADTKENAVYDEKWTSEAIYNILDNAVKYTLQNGRIEINIIPYQFFCRIDIKDTGIGIAEDEQAKIFRRFYRSQAVNQTEGVGIGLFLAREIISGEGGYIKVQSKLGKGSVFSVFLPIEI